MEAGSVEIGVLRVTKDAFGPQPEFHERKRAVTERLEQIFKHCDRARILATDTKQTCGAERQIGLAFLCAGSDRARKPTFQGRLRLAPVAAVKSDYAMQQRAGYLIYQCARFLQASGHYVGGRKFCHQVLADQWKIREPGLGEAFCQPGLCVRRIPKPPPSFSVCPRSPREESGIT